MAHVSLLSRSLKDNRVGRCRPSAGASGNDGGQENASQHLRVDLAGVPVELPEADHAGDRSQGDKQAKRYGRHLSEGRAASPVDSAIIDPEADTQLLRKGVRGGRGNASEYHGDGTRKPRQLPRPDG